MQSVNAVVRQWSRPPIESRVNEVINKNVKASKKLIYESSYLITFKKQVYKYTLIFYIVVSYINYNIISQKLQYKNSNLE